jgi:hypothetical protein
MLNEKEKIVIVGGAVIIVGGLLFYFSKNLLEFIGIKPDAEEKAEKTEAKKKEKELETAQEDKVKILINKGATPSYLPATYLNAANVIHDNTKRVILDDNDKIAVAELLRYTPKQIDFEKIAEAYGVREHFGFLGVSMGKRNLIQCLTQELSSSEKNKINAVFKTRGLTTRIN